MKKELEELINWGYKDIYHFFTFIIGGAFFAIFIFMSFMGSYCMLKEILK